MKTINAMMLSLAALTIAGCSQNEVTEISPDAHPQVGFGQTLFVYGHYFVVN